MATLVSVPKNPFLAWIDRIGQKALAEAIGVDPTLVNHWRWGRRKPNIEQTKAIVAYAGGQLTRADVRPDVYDE